MANKNFDVIIIGGGAAGLSAALWCDDLGLESVLLESNDELGGQLLWTHNSIKNHLGIEAENGRAMRDIFVEQLENRKFKLCLKTVVQEVDLQNKIVKTQTGEVIQAKAIIIATGIKRRELNVDGEKGFQGKGIITSGKRDGKLVENKRVAIIGGGDAAFENCQILSQFASKIYLINRSKTFRAREEFLIPAQNNSKVEIITETVVTKLIGQNCLEAIELENKDSKKYRLPIDFLLLRIGVEPNTSLFQGQIETDSNGYVKVNGLCESSLANIYSIGDVANPVSPTISSAVGMGATAVKAILSKMK